MKASDFPTLIKCRSWRYSRALVYYSYSSWSRKGKKKETRRKSDCEKDERENMGEKKVKRGKNIQHNQRFEETSHTSFILDMSCLIPTTAS